MCFKKKNCFLNVKDILDEQYFCPSCDYIFEDVCQTECGCRFCMNCFKKIIKINQKCLKCDGIIQSEVPIKDKAFQKEIENLNINCKLCSWSGKYILYREHFKQHQTVISENTKVNSTCFHDILTDRSLNLPEKALNRIEYLYKNVQLKIKNLEETVKSMKQTQRIESDNIDSTNRTSNNTINLLKEDLDKLNNWINYMKKDLNQVVNTNEVIKNNLKEYEQTMNRMQENLETTTKTLTCAQAVIITLEEEILSLKNVTQNGMYVWKITHVRDKTQEAKSGRQTSIYSSPFYTSQYGYKMCARLYLNGDGIGRNTHLSLFFVIMRGEYDSLLKWPFKQKITFILIDQSQNENIVDSFKPDPNSNSFKKPTSDMNIASGIPLFCPLSKLYSTDHEYIKDDCMFVKVIVDSRDLVDF